MKLLVQVEFTRSGWRQFGEMNRSHGARFIRGYVLLREVAAFITAHEDQGISLDTICQELRYDNGIYLLLMRHQGIWYITEIWATDTPTRFLPVYLWRRVKRGFRDFIAKVLVCWRNLTEDCSAEGGMLL